MKTKPEPKNEAPHPPIPLEGGVVCCEKSALAKLTDFKNGFPKSTKGRKTRIRHLRAVVLFYKKRKSVGQIAETLGYKPLYVRKILKSEPMKFYVQQLSNGFIEKARDFFDKMIAEMEAGEYTNNSPDG